MKNLKGLSLSFCIQDMLNGKVDLNQVTYIETNTKCNTDEDWTRFFEIYCNVYWRKFPEKAIKLVKSMIVKRQIYQPRLNYDIEQRSISEGHWIIIDDQGREQEYFQP